MKRGITIKLIAVIFAGLCLANASAQKVILAGAAGELYSFDPTPGSCAIQPLTSPCAGPASYFSIALFKDTLYHLTGGSLYISVLNNPAACKRLLNVFSNALTVDREGLLYWTSGFNLIKYDPHTNAMYDLGRMTYTSSGDLVFYKTKLLMAASEGIVEIDLQAKPITSTLVLPTPGRAFYGIFSLPVDCNNNKVYALEAGTNSSKVVEFDLENKTILGSYCTLPIGVNDAASITESGVSQGITVNNIAIKHVCGADEKGGISINAFSGSANVALEYTLNNANANTDGKFAPLTAGTYAIHIKSSDGCLLDTNVDVKLVDKIELNLTSVPDTCQSKNGSLSVQKISGTEPFTFLLDNTISQSALFFAGLSSGVHTLKVTDQNACLLETDFTVKAFSPALPLNSITITSATCNGGGAVKLAFDPSANITGARLDNDIFTPVDQFSNVSAGQHHVQVKTSSCIFDTVIVVPVSAVLQPVVSFTNKPTDCFGGNTGSSSVNISNIVQPFTVNFNGRGHGPATSFTGLAAGVYDLIIKDGNGCTWQMTDTISAYVVKKPVIQTNITHAECWQTQPGKIRLTMSGAGSPYFFELNGHSYLTGQEASQLPPGDYYTRVFSADRCPVDSFTITIKQQNTYGADCDTVYVPSGFTPNGDGSNDLLRPVVSGGTRSFVFRVYNRAGQSIYETHTAGQGWDGKLKGVQQPSGAYVWILECKDAADRKKVYNGTFVLIR